MAVVAEEVTKRAVVPGLADVNTAGGNEQVSRNDMNAQRRAGDGGVWGGFMGDQVLLPTGIVNSLPLRFCVHANSTPITADGRGRSVGRDAALRVDEESPGKVLVQSGSQLTRSLEASTTTNFPLAP
jgi:hypothetical protein